MDTKKGGPLDLPGRMECYRTCIDAIEFLLRQAGDPKLFQLAYTQAVSEFGALSDEELKKPMGKNLKRLTRAISITEKDFGVKLRTKSEPVQAERSAKAFTDHLRRFVGAYDSIKKLGRETVRISAIDSAVNVWIPLALRDCFQNTKSPPHILCTTREWWEVLEDVQKGHADFGFATTMPTDAVQSEIVLHRPHFAVFSSSLSQLVNRKTIGFKDFAKYGAVCLHHFASPVGKQAEFRSRKARVICVDTCTQMLSFVAQGMGIAMLTEDLMPQSGEFTMRPLSFPTIYASDALYLARPRQRQSDETDCITDGSSIEQEDDTGNVSDDAHLSDSARVVYNAIAAYWRLRNQSNGVIKS